MLTRLRGFLGSRRSGGVGLNLSLWVKAKSRKALKSWLTMREFNRKAIDNTGLSAEDKFQTGVFVLKIFGRAGHAVVWARTPGSF
jgi:hypothetical protein